VFVNVGCIRFDSLTQKQQTDVLQRFRDGGFNTLVCTSIGEEGLDIGEVCMHTAIDRWSTTRLSFDRGAGGPDRVIRCGIVTHWTRAAYGSHRPKAGWQVRDSWAVCVGVHMHW